MNWDGKVRWHTPFPWPNERITITHKRYAGPHVESNQRTCYGSEHVYATLKNCEPNYPVPALRQLDTKWGATMLECVVFDYFTRD
jgi:hypothetical protein